MCKTFYKNNRRSNLKLVRCKPSMELFNNGESKSPSESPCFFMWQCYFCLAAVLGSSRNYVLACHVLCVRPKWANTQGMSKFSRYFLEILEIQPWKFTFTLKHHFSFNFNVPAIICYLKDSFLWGILGYLLCVKSCIEIWSDNSKTWFPPLSRNLSFELFGQVKSLFLPWASFL